uniref:Uncharacterized protein n=1 Tax=Oryza glumipatula TaxID=40148 RepID=A0A0D9YT96_9ORYZ
MGHGPRVVCPFLYPCLAARVNQELPQFCRTRSSAEALKDPTTASPRKYLSMGCLSTQLLGVFDHLKKIRIEKCFWNWIESFSHPEAFRRKRTWDQDQTEIEEPTLHHLVIVIINDFVALDCEVALVGLLLSWSSLDELKIF